MNPYQKRKELLDFFKSTLFSREKYYSEERIKYLESVSTPILEDRYRFVQDHHAEHPYSKQSNDLDASFNDCAVCNKKVWTGMLIHNSYYQHFKDMEFYSAHHGPWRNSIRFVCSPECKAVCGCPDHEQVSRDFQDYCNACGNEYCTVHQNSCNVHFCRDCFDTLEWGKQVKKLFSEKPPPGWSSFYKMVASFSEKAKPTH